MSFLKRGRSLPERDGWRLRTALLLAAPITLLVLGYDRRWLDDDGFINLRIVRHLLHGEGPVFNLGERVEAATSPLWLGLLAVLGALGLRLEDAAVYGGIVLTTLGLVLAQDAAWRLCRRYAPTSGALRHVPLPVGAILYVAFPPAWDYASSGLETGLALTWLGGSYRVVAGYVEGDIDSIGAEGASPLRIAVLAALLGLGPLIRPELSLTSGVFLVLFGTACLRRGRRVRAAGWARLKVLVLVALAGAALPLVYQVFRMGYYAACVPNTALAKEAFLHNGSQGLCYFRNFFGLYKTSWPVAALGIFLAARLYDHAVSGRTLAWATTLAPLIVALAQVGYVVAIGGDYMHGRMFLPPVFTALLPIAVIPWRVPPLPGARPVLAFAGVVAVGWSLVCGLWFRVGTENVCGIGDERSWYARAWRGVEQSRRALPTSAAISSTRMRTRWEDASPRRARLPPPRATEAGAARCTSTRPRRP